MHRCVGNWSDNQLHNIYIYMRVNFGPLETHKSTWAVDAGSILTVI